MPPRESLKSLTMTQRPPWMTRLKAQCLAEARSKRANIAMARRRRVLADKPIWTMQQTQGEEGDDDLGQSGSFDDGDQDEESLQNLLRLNWARTLAEAAATGIPPLDEETANRLEEEMLAELEGEGDDFERMAEDQLKILDAELDDCLATHHGSNVMVAPCMVCQRGYLHNESPHTIQCNACTARMSFSTATTVGEVVDQLVSLADLHG
ncbi:hypothetical protein DFJ73DRAFT_835912 [Zopfochytrium polystomum]|nr:hypothetical protein DFJ73DRAFT_835912 [Zopfochytrium polystomum]